MASPPSSRIMFGPWPPGPGEDLLRAPPVLGERLALPGEDRHAGRGVAACRSRPTTTAAAAWSWVEKMLQLAQRTSAPRAVSVSISTAVWIVMCREPAIRAPGKRLRLAVALAHRHQARHLVLGERDLGPPEVGERQVGDLEVHAYPLRQASECPGGHDQDSCPAARGRESGRRRARRARSSQTVGAPDVRLDEDVGRLGHGLPGCGPRPRRSLRHVGGALRRGRPRSWHATRTLDGPSCSVRRWMICQPVAVARARMAASMSSLVLQRRRLAEQQALGLDAEDDGHGDEQQADRRSCRRRPSSRCLVSSVRPDAEQREAPDRSAPRRPPGAPPAAPATWPAG